MEQFEKSEVKKQLEASLEQRIEVLQITNQKEAKVLEQMKGKIVDSIAKGDESQDGKIDLHELKEVFNKLYAADKESFSANGIRDFHKFLKYLGVNDSIQLNTGMEAKVFGKHVDLVLPLGVSEAERSNFQAALMQLESNPSLKEQIREGMEIKTRAGLELNFTIEQGGRSQEIVATPEGVFMRESNIGFTPEEYEEWAQLETRNVRIKNLSSEESDRLTDLSIKIKFRFFTNIKTGESMTAQQDHPGSSVVSYFYNSYESSVDYEQGFLTQKSETLASGNKYYKSFNHQGVLDMEYEVDKKFKIIRAKEYDSEGKLKKSFNQEEETFFGKDGEVILFVKKNAKGEVIHRTMPGLDGGEVSTIDQLKGMSPDEYLTMLAKELNTPDRMAAFFENFIHYVYDDKTKRTDSFRSEQMSEGADYWQTALETATRVEEGTMLGDCDDYAFLSKEILDRQGKEAFVLGIPGHAICLWFEDRPDGKFDVFTMGTFGLDKNGGISGGFTNKREAINAVLVKYDKPGLGIDVAKKYRVEDEVTILNIPEKGERSTISAPIEALGDPNLYEDIKTLEQYGLSDLAEFNEIRAHEDLLIWKKKMKEAEGEERIALMEQAPDSIRHFSSELESLALGLRFGCPEEKKQELLEKYAEHFEETPIFYEELVEFVKYDPDKKEKLLEYSKVAIEHGTERSDPYEILISSYRKAKDFQAIVGLGNVAKERGVDIDKGDLIFAHIQLNNLDEALVYTEADLSRSHMSDSYARFLYIRNQQGVSIESLWSELPQKGMNADMKAASIKRLIELDKSLGGDPNPEWLEVQIKYKEQAFYEQPASYHANELLELYSEDAVAKTLLHLNEVLGQEMDPRLKSGLKILKIQLLLSQGKSDDAVDFFKENSDSINLDFTFFDDYMWRDQRGVKDEDMLKIIKVIQGYGESPTLCYCLSRIYGRQGNKKRAKLWEERGKKLNRREMKRN